MVMIMEMVMEMVMVMVIVMVMVREMVMVMIKIKPVYGGLTSAVTVGDGLTKMEKNAER